MSGLTDVHSMSARTERIVALQLSEGLTQKATPRGMSWRGVEADPSEGDGLGLMLS